MPGFVNPNNAYDRLKLFTCMVGDEGVDTATKEVMDPSLKGT